MEINAATLRVLNQAIFDKGFRKVVGRTTTPARHVHVITVRGTDGRA